MTALQTLLATAPYTSLTDQQAAAGIVDPDPQNRPRHEQLIDCGRLVTADHVAAVRKSRASS